MMEFYLSKVWVFVVGLMLMLVLVQSVNMQGQVKEDEAMRQVAKEIGEMLESLNEAGPGLQRTVEMRSVLPDTASLTVHGDYAVLTDGRYNISFSTPPTALFVQLNDGNYLEVESLVIEPDDCAKIMTNERGLMICLQSANLSARYLTASANIPISSSVL
jgi:hypothetical protein